MIVQKSSEIQIERTKCNGTQRHFSANWCKVLKDEFNQGVSCTNLSTIMQVHAQMSFGTKSAYRKPPKSCLPTTLISIRSAEDMWSFQMLDNEVGQRAHPDDYSRSFGLSQFHESDTDLQRVPQEAHSKSFCSSQVLQDGWDSEKDLLELFSTGCPAGEVRSTYWDFERLEVEELPTDSMPCWGSGGFPNCPKLCPSRVVKLLLDRSRWLRCFNPFKAPTPKEVNLLRCR